MSADWYPKIDYLKCTKCLTCYDFCPHEVYSLNDDTPVVAKPENCISGCHGCENRCPEGALSYIGDTASGKILFGGKVKRIDTGVKLLEGKKMEVQDLLRLITVEHLHYANEDQETCERCGDTLQIVREVVEEIKEALKLVKVQIEFKDVPLLNETDEELKVSNSIRFTCTDLGVKNVDIEEIVEGAAVNSNYCQSCSDLIGKKTFCRTVTYKGQTYEAVPKAMIVEAVLKLAFAPKPCCDPLTTSCSC